MECSLTGVVSVGASATTFYLTCSLSMLAVWAALSVGGGSDYHRRGLACGLATRPSWLPGRALTAILKRPWAYLLVCHSAPLAMLAAGLTGAGESQGVRIMVAVVLSLYNLVESSVTSSHRDFANMYVRRRCRSLVGPSSLTPPPPFAGTRRGRSRCSTDPTWRPHASASAFTSSTGEQRLAWATTEHQPNLHVPSAGRRCRRGSTDL